jgi:lysophospholipase L1-like esterase
MALNLQRQRLLSLGCALLACLFSINCPRENHAAVPSQPQSNKEISQPMNEQRTQQVRLSEGPINYVALGDSTGAGLGSKHGGYVVRLFEMLRRQRSGSKLNNLCVSGATTADVHSFQLKRGIDSKPQLVTIGIGINDISHGVSLDEFAANFENILRRLKAESGSTLVVSNIPDVSSSSRVPPSMREQSQATIERFNNRLQQIAEANEVIVFDVYGVTHQELPSHPEYFSADEFHPSDAGYQLWADRMWPTVATAPGVKRLKFFSEHK